MHGSFFRQAPGLQVQHDPGSFPVLQVEPFAVIGDYHRPGVDGLVTRGDPLVAPRTPPPVRLVPCLQGRGTCVELSFAGDPQ